MEDDVQVPTLEELEERNRGTLKLNRGDFLLRAVLIEVQIGGFNGVRPGDLFHLRYEKITFNIGGKTINNVVVEVGWPETDTFAGKYDSDLGTWFWKFPYAQDYCVYLIWDVLHKNLPKPLY